LRGQLESGPGSDLAVKLAEWTALNWSGGFRKPNATLNAESGTSPISALSSKEKEINAVAVHIVPRPLGHLRMGGGTSTTCHSPRLFNVSPLVHYCHLETSSNTRLVRGGCINGSLSSKQAAVEYAVEKGWLLVEDRRSVSLTEERAALVRTN
jgi:hypothetical protein